MKFGVCKCRSFDSRKLLVGIVIHLVLLSLGFPTAAETHLEEAPCQSRPTVVEVSESHEHRPYFVILNRCSGSCSPHSPHVRTCKEKHWVGVDVVVTDSAGRQTTKTMKNHTDCECSCKSNPGVCDWSKVGQDWLAHRCTCAVQTGPVVGGSHTSGGGSSPPTAYIFGLAGMGLLVLFVVVIDAMLCARKGKGVLFCATRSCRSTNDPTDATIADEKPKSPPANGHMNGTAQYLRASRTSIV